MDILRFATAGSVDDGKSTLIGRLLYDSKAIFDDQLSAVESASQARNDDYTNLALLTDGLRAEREQGITIDVAYRYFATPARKFIIADTPGHIQYTRNMVTGASTADLALVLVDARKGIVEQSRRHAYLCSMLRVPHVVLCVNKMDLVDWSQECFDAIAAEFQEFATGLRFASHVAIPVAALSGDNVVNPSENMPWYQGQPLLRYLETVSKADEREVAEARFPIQYVIKESGDVLYAGQVAAGVLRPGQQVTVQPGGGTSRIASIAMAGSELDAACAPMSVTIRLDDDGDTGDQAQLRRGDMLCAGAEPISITDAIEATVCWADESKPMRPGATYTLKHTTRMVRADVKELRHRVDINDLGRTDQADELSLNEIGLVTLRTSEPLICDRYSRHRVTGSFILIDDETNRTVASGIIL